MSTLYNEMNYEKDFYQNWERGKSTTQTNNKINGNEEKYR